MLVQDFDCRDSVPVFALLSFLPIPLVLCVDHHVLARCPPAFEHFEDVMLATSLDGRVATPDLRLRKIAEHDWGIARSWSCFNHCLFQSLEWA